MTLVLSDLIACSTQTKGLIILEPILMNSQYIRLDQVSKVVMSYFKGCRHGLLYWKASGVLGELELADVDNRTKMFALLVLTIDLACQPCQLRPRDQWYLGGMDNTQQHSYFTGN
jgi:hypothetical protein